MTAINERAGRTVIQAFVALIILGLAAAHLWLNKAVFPPLDAYCPFGALESAWRLIADGKFIEKTFALDLVLAGVLLVITLAFGGIFCGRVCPFGGLQNWLHRLGHKLRLPDLKPPQKIGKWLSMGRYLLLLLINLKTIQLTTLWFGGFDPFRIIFGLHWPSEPGGLSLTAYVIAVLVLLVSLVVSRPWCRFFCPLGGAVALISRLSPFRLRRDQRACASCKACDRACGLDLQPSRDRVAGCNLCGDCVAKCPVPGALAASWPRGKLRSTSVAPAVALLALAAAVTSSFVFGWTRISINGDPESIKGWMTLGQVAEAYGLSLEELKHGVGLDRTMAKAHDELRKFEHETPVPGFSMENVREFIAAKAGGKVQPEAADDMEEEAAPSVPVPQDVRAPASGRLDLNEIRGSLILREVIDRWRLDREELYQRLGLPNGVEEDMLIRDFHQMYGVGAEAVREAVAVLLGNG